MSTASWSAAPTSSRRCSTPASWPKRSASSSPRRRPRSNPPLRRSPPRCRSNSRERLDGRGLCVLFDLEGRAAAACGDDVRVVDLEPGALQAFDVVDLRAEDELHAHLVDDDGDPVDLEDVIVVLGFVEGEGVLEA